MHGVGDNQFPLNRTIQSKRRSRRLAILALAIGAVTLPTASRAIAGSDSWLGTSDGNWTDGTRWSNASPPGAGDDAYITTSFNGTQTITFDYGGPAITFGSVTVDAIGGGANILSLPAGNLTSGGMTVGYSGIGTFSQSGGSNTVTGSTSSLVVGYAAGSMGSYTMGAGSALTANNDEIVGYSGTGVFTQNDGTNTFAGGGYDPSRSLLQLGFNAGSTGTYNLAGGTLYSPQLFGEVIGNAGVGVFNQTGGVNNINDNYFASGHFDLFQIGNLAGSTGTYNLMAGTLNLFVYSTPCAVGFSGLGIFNQSGGVVNSNATTLGYNAGSRGTYTLSNGILNAKALEVGISGTGNFNQSGGTVEAIFFRVAENSGSTGSYLLSSGLLNVPGDSETIGYSGIGSFTQMGGANIIGGTNSTNTFYLGINQGSTGTYTMSGGTLTLANTGNAEYIGYSGVGHFNQSGGTNSFAGTLYMAKNFALNSTSTYSLSGDSLLSVTGSPGAFIPDGRESLANGVFNQSGGTNSYSYELDVGLGGYSLSGGMVVGAGNAREYVGLFNQTGGVNTMGRLILGQPEVGSSKTSVYTLSAGSLNAGTETISGGNFNQSGGVNTIGTTLTMDATISTSAYSLTGGTLSTGGSAYIGGTSQSSGGTATFNVSGTGQLNVAGQLQIWQHGTMTLGGPSTAYTTVGSLQIASGGLLNVTNTALTINYGTGASPSATIRGYISSGYNAGGSLWTGTGITSSAAAADPAHHSVAFADGADGVVTNLPAGISSAIPNGGTLPAGSELVTYAFAGDANLDGKVDFADFIVLSNHFGTSDINWDHGNFNYDSIVDFSDFIVLSNNFGAGTGLGNGTGATPAELAQYNALAERFGISQAQIAAWDQAVLSLPEPASAGLLASGGMILLRPRRRR